MSLASLRVKRAAAAFLMLAFAVLWFWLMDYALSMAGSPTLTDPTATARDLAQEGLEGHMLSDDADSSSLYFAAPEPER